MLVLCFPKQNIILILPMRSKQHNLSEKHQAKSHHSDFQIVKTQITKNRSQIYFQEIDAKEVLSKYDDEPYFKNIYIDQEDIVGWQANARQMNLKKATFFQKQIKPHEKRPFHGKLQPINTKNIEKCSTNDTINYLKKMLTLLRSSREANHPQTNVLKQRNYDIQGNPNKHKRQSNQDNLSKINEKKPLQLPNVIIQKQNEYNDAQIINQLKHGLYRLPSINPSKRSTISIRARRGSKFTLDKLLI